MLSMGGIPLGEQNNNASVQELEKEIHCLERQILCCPDPGKKRVLKRRLKRTEYRRLLLLGKLG